MHGDAALSEDGAQDARSRTRRSNGEANLLIMPNARRRQHLLQPAEDRGRRRRRRSGPILLGAAQAGAHPDAVGDRAPHRQHDGADRRSTASSSGRRSCRTDRAASVVRASTNAFGARRTPLTAGHGDHGGENARPAAFAIRLRRGQ